MVDSRGRWEETGRENTDLRERTPERGIAPLTTSLDRRLPVTPREEPPSKVCPVTPRRRRSQLPLFLLVTCAVLLPIIPVLWLSYSRAIARAEDSLRVRTDIALQRADRILRMADETLQRLARDIGSLSLVQAAELMQRTVYYQPYFREAGLIDESGNLVCTSLGPVAPPIAVPPEHKSNPAVPTMQIVGLIKTTVMPTESIIVGLPTSGRGEVNLLIDPSTLIDLFAELDLGPNGSIAFLTSDGKVLASRGSPPGLTAKTPSDLIRLDRRSERFSIVVVGTSSRLWALRDWRNDLAIILPVGLLQSQFATLEEPGADERPIVVDVAGSPPDIVAEIIRQLGVPLRAPV